MGSCASVYRNSETDMKFRLSFGSKTERLGIPPSPVKENYINGNNNFRIDDIALKSQRSPSRSTTNFRDYGSKEETFFDSKPWLDSDCEDDFYSVNGEFTPSRGNTPIHHSFGTPRVNKTPFENRSPASMTAPSPTEKKKKLLELFRDSVRDDHERDDNNNSLGILNMDNAKKEGKPIINVSLPKSARSTPYNISGTNSVCSSAERTSNADAVSFREKTVKSMQGCLPSLSSCRSFSERKRKMSPAPAVAVNGKP